jgi:FkbM family methyltransferase
MKLSRSYAQFNTDVIIASYFDDNEILYGLDIGAVDGIFINNTYAFEKEHNAQILCIEANPVYKDALSKNRKLSKSCAVGSENKNNVDFHVVKVHDHNNLSSVSSLQIDKKLLDDHKKNYTLSQWTEKVDVRTIDSILEEWDPPKLDFVSIDIEGTELQALSAWTGLRTYNPKLLIVEANSEDHEKSLIEFFKNHNYALNNKIEVNLFFVPVNHQPNNKI